MGLKASLWMALLGTVLATYDTHDSAPSAPSVSAGGRPPGVGNNIPLLGMDPEETPAYGQNLSVAAAVLGEPAPKSKGLRPSEHLNMYEWIALMRQLGWYDEAVTEEQFWARLEEWNLSEESRLEAQTAALSALQASASPSSPSGLVTG